MSEVLARIRVRETAGIRRFLYPLTASFAFRGFVELSTYKLATAEGLAVPFQIVLDPEDDECYWLYFAVSLDPHAEIELLLTPGISSTSISDPLCLKKQPDTGLLSNEQQRFAIDVAHSGLIKTVVYDEVTFLRTPLQITRNNEPPDEDVVSYHYASSEASKIYACVMRAGIYSDNIGCGTETMLTACKSWATVTHVLSQPQPNDEVVFTLPLAITAPTLTCDFGVGGYVFGKLDDKATEIVWHTEFGEAPYAKWTVATAGRVDYVGEVATAEEFLPQRWFHLIDSDKAIAVAITFLPDDCREMTVRLTRDGDVSVAFELGKAVTGHAEFGVCYHFLNDVPAIAAATNPQSILLPPVVKVL